MEDKQLDIDASHRHHILVRRIIIVLVFVMALAGIGFGTVLLLKGVVPRASTSNPNNSVSSISYRDIIASYRKPGAVSSLDDSVYSQQGDIVATMLLKDEGRLYGVNVSADQTVLFRAKNKLNADDSQSIQNQTTAFMNSSGYQEVESQQKSVSGGPFYKVYQSDSAVCQLTDSGLNVPDGGLPYHMLACLEKTAIAKEYEVTEKMLALYKKANNLPVFTSVSRSSVVEGDKSLMTFDFVGDNKNTKLLFAAMNDNWEYICNLSGNSGETSAKYVITTDAKKALQNPKYGDFLTRYILGGAQ